MAFENNQKEPALPGGDKNYKRRSANHLPKYFRTEFNNKFLNATLDQMLQPGVAEKINAYYGRKVSKAFNQSDNYVGDFTTERENYQLEPVSVIKDNLGNVNFYADYNDFINKTKIVGGSTEDHSVLNSQETYAWNPHIDWDKFVNFREYYWLPTGPTTTTVIGQTKEVQSEYTVRLSDNVDNVTYLFTPDGLTNNPTITLYRGQTYRFDIDTPSYAFAFATQRSFTPGQEVGDSLSNVSLIYDTGVKKYDEDGAETDDVYLDKGTIEFTVPDTAPDQLYYISKTDPNVSGFIKVFDIEENTEINVEAEILGKKNYTTSAGWALSNGMKLNFAGQVTPTKYATGEWYVEGVGEEIQLVSQEDLNVSGLFTEDIEVEFDKQEFDYYPFSEALGFPQNKDYIVINRGSQDGNLWSRYNRWFHKSVIEKSAELNGQSIAIDQNSRASRPIIEFEKGLKLFQFGTKTKTNIDLIDTFTIDAFSTIEGSLGYNIDGVNLTNGMRVLFTADTDLLVKGKIYTVKFITVNNRTQISLVETTDSTPQLNETVLVTAGNANRGKYFYYDGTTWKQAQNKNSVNQQPLFDMYDDNDVNYLDSTTYESSQFIGNKVFSYNRSNGVNDTELGFPLEYRSIENSGDILFTFDLLQGSFVYTKDNTLVSEGTDKGFLRKYKDRTNYTLTNGWQKADKDSTQNVIRQYVHDGSARYEIDMYDDKSFIDTAWLRVYVNNKIKKITTDFVIEKDVNNHSYIKFNNDLTDGDIIVIKCRSRFPKNKNGYYEIASNLERNPINSNVNQFTLGEVNDHVASIVEEANEFVGQFPGTSNMRDIGNLTRLGKKYLKHSAPLNFPLFHFLDESSNVIKALEFARKEYGKFKRLFVEVATNLGYEGDVKIHFDKIMQEINKDKISHMPFYFSDMVATGGNVVNTFEIEDTDEKFFPLSAIYDINTPSNKSVQIYLNGLQLIYGKDYTFNTEGFAVITATKQIGDKILIYEYDNTNGSYVPPTPTKLGLYPKFEPDFYIDDTVKTAKAPDIPTGPYKVYGVAGPDQMGSGKLGWFYPLYTTITEAQTRDTELGGSGQAHAHTFKGLNRTFFMPNSVANHGVQDDETIEEWTEGVPVIQGHDGSKITAYKDYRDNLILELEKRIYNNLKVSYDVSLFDINDFAPGLDRKTGLSKTQIDNAMIADFLAWLRLVNEEYTKQAYYDRENSFTFNYGQTTYLNTELLPGWWRQAFMYAYDTDRPHTHPWEMLGISVKPTWWETQYGPGPYTRNNLPLWQDLSAGIVRQPNFKVDKKYVRPNLLNTIPVDENGNLLSPNDCGLSQNFNIGTTRNSFKFGDGAPVETAWRRSSEYPFSLLRALTANKPCKTFATAFDRIRQKRNSANQIIYSTSGKQIELSQLVFPTVLSDTAQTFTSGLINYIFDYQTSINNEQIAIYKDRVKNITNQIGFKIGGFTDKNKFKLLLDSRTPLNEGNVFVPEENYKIFLNSSFPQQEVSYSGVIVEKRPEGYYIKGYDNQNPKFNYYPTSERSNDPLINVGGVSEAYVDWSSGKVYVVGTIVKNSNSFYRATKTHTSGASFEEENFSKLPSLPLIGGRDAFVRQNFENRLTQLNYGSLLPTIQDVVDFLLGYEKYLNEVGFTFSEFRTDSYEVSNWLTSAKEFMFWTTQNWGSGSIITLSPAADKINFTSNYSTVDNVYNTFYGYSILKADGKKLDKENLKFAKDSDNNFSCRTINTADGIYAIKLPLVSKEHVVLIDNVTVFGDVIYDIAPGYRQERIKVLGYRTDEWNGSLNIPGFIYDDAQVTEWTTWTDYAIGSIVKYKEFYYSAKNKIAGTATFNDDQWVRLQDKPQAGLFANFDYKINQFADFYDLDSDNFDTEQQKLAQHLIGYQKRKYLENIINDDVSQYKFYQGFIQDKGSKNALTKLFDALASANQDSLEFYEEWAIKDGQYGASTGFDEVEYKLDEKQFKLTPQPILLTNQISGTETDLIYRIPEYETYLKPQGYNHRPFPTKYITKGYTKDSGYVNPQDVDFIIGSYESLIDLDVDKLYKNNYVWVGNVNFDWSVYQYTQMPYNIQELLKEDTGFSIRINGTPSDINKGDILGLIDIKKTTFDPEDSTQEATFTAINTKGFFKVKEVSQDKITFDTDTKVDEDLTGLTGTLTYFKSVRAKDLNEANDIAQRAANRGFKIWIDDNGTGRWTVQENTGKYEEQIVVSNTQTIEDSTSGGAFATAIAVDLRNGIMAVGSPENEDGKVFVYTRASESLNWQLQQVLDAPINIAGPGQGFGSSIDISSDNKWLMVGAPNASFAKTNFQGNYDATQNYITGNIVEYQNSNWQAVKDIEGSQPNILFNSFGNYNQILYNLNLDEENSEQVPLLLAGNYPFTNTTADHFLVRAPRATYLGIDLEDEVKLQWNKRTNANQQQVTLSDRDPFDGTIPYITKEFLETDHTVSKKVDLIFYIDQTTNIPNIGETVTTLGATAKVIYTFAVGGSTTIYCNEQNGVFPASNSLFIAGNDFVGEYTIAGPNDTTNTASELGGYLFIQTSPYSVGTTNSDSGRGLVIKDVVTDSTNTGRYYYNILDIETATIDSLNTQHSLVRTLTHRGAPGPGGTDQPTLDSRFVMRAPKALTDTIQIGDSVDVYFNNLKKTVYTLVVDSPTSVVQGEILTQNNSNATATVFANATNTTTIQVTNITGTWDTVDLIVGSQSGPLVRRPTVIPNTNVLVQPSDIGLTYENVNKTQTLVDKWDGYIEYVNLFFLNGELFEPVVGQTVRDVTTGATAEVAYYQRNLNRIVIFVKNISGSWSRGDLFGDNAEIEMLAYGPGPDPDAFGRTGIYSVDRKLGQIQQVSLGYSPADIGKLLVFDTGSNIPTLVPSNITNLPPGNQYDQIIGGEYWLYKQGQVAGIPRLANIPGSSNADWSEVFVINTTPNGTASSFANEGIVYAYQRFGGNYQFDSGIVSSNRRDNHRFGSKVRIGLQNNLYRGFISALDDETTSNPGRIYFIKNGTENNNIYSWEYAKNKKFKGTYDESLSYVENDIVYLGGKLFTATTNLLPGAFNPEFWTSTDDLIDYVGYVPNDTGLKVVNDSSLDSVIDQNGLYDFGTDYDVSADGQVLITSVKYETKPNVVAIYRNNRGYFGWSQDIEAPTTGSDFGKSVRISNDGTLIVISAPTDDTVKNDQGRVFVYKQINGRFEQVQILQSPQNESAEMFGFRIEFDGETLAVNSKNADNFNQTTFDKSVTTFDNKFTNFRYETEEGGTVYVYQNVNDRLLYGDSLRYETPFSNVNYFGRNLALAGNHIYVGLPTVKSEQNYTGTLVDFRLPGKLFTDLRLAKPVVDVNKIKRIILYNTKTNKLVKYLDYIDPIQGKIFGVAEENLSYKLYYDPATYTTSTVTGLNVNQTNSWDKNQVGELWWDLTNAKFYYPYLDDVTFSTNNWNKVFDTNSIDIYEWVESEYTPSQWDSLTDTDEGISQGISGTSKHGDNAYVQKKDFDEISQRFTNKYYFWVKNKKIIPNVEGRSLKASDVADAISDPAGKGYQFVGLFSDNSFAIYNCRSLLENKDIAISIQYWTIDNQNQNIHNQYQIITDGLATSKPNRDIENKWIDSLVGYDAYGKLVPDPTLGEKEKYGIQNKPRQSWFKNRAEALKQYIERVNNVLKQQLIVDSKNLTNITQQEPAPSSVTRVYDTTVDTKAELDLLGIANFRQAKIELSIVDGVVVDAILLDPGRGYLVAPTYTVSGTGTGLELEFAINNLGVITNVNIVNGGQNYKDNTTIEIRKFSVLVNNDETIQGKWSIYERLTGTNSWSRIRSQAYNTNLYWEYIDWYDIGYSSFTEINHLIDFSYQLDGLDDGIGEIVKISNVGTGGWLLLEKIDDQTGVDYTVNYKTIGRQNGTIKFKSTLYDTDGSADGFDIISFDTKFFDSLPTSETRIVLNAIKNDIFVNDLAIEYNKLFFASIRYVLSEQSYVDWVFKTSFIKAKHNVGELREDITFNNDNLPSYQSYIDEVKPFKTKLREYVSSYEKVDNSQSRISDFDLPPSYNEDTKNIEPLPVKIQNAKLTGTGSIGAYPEKSWLDNVGFIVKEIQIADSGSGYQGPPKITLSGGGGSGATAITKVGTGGKITAVEVTNSGSGYLEAPTITIDGSVAQGGTPAKLSVIIGQSLPRNIYTKVKFDRTTGLYLITNLSDSKNFVGTGSKYNFDLDWPMDMKTTNVSVTVSGQELLRSQFSYSNFKDNTKGYDRYFGRITLTEPPAVSTAVVVTYLKDIDLLQAQDRINLAYNPVTGQYSKDLGQLMDGIDYGGVEVKSFDFGGPSGWDTAPYYTGAYDTYDTSFEDEVIKLDGSTITLQLSKALENGAVYNVYKNGVRLDDPDWTDDSTQFTNPNAIMRSIIGDGTTTTVELQELGIITQADDIIIVRKTTSDGSFLPTDINYDTLLTGGDLAYTSAQGLNSEEINVDGDGFVTPTTSKGPEELIPGQVQDSVDITVYERPTTGASNIVSRNYIGNGSTTIYDIGTQPISDKSLFVKVDGEIKTLTTDYTIDYGTSTLTFVSAPGIGAKINLSTLEYSGANILDIDEFIADGSTVNYLTNIRWNENVSTIISVDGKLVPNDIVESTKADVAPNNIMIKFATPPKQDSIIRYAVFQGEVQNYSAVTIDEFEADGSTSYYTLTQTPFTQTPAEWYTIVRLNDKILNAGYNEVFDVTATREYRLKLYQVPLASLNNEQIRVYLNNQELEFITQWTFSSAEAFDPSLPLSQQSGSAILLADDVGVAGDKLRVFVNGWDDSTLSGGDYRYGYFDVNGNFVKKPGELYINTNYQIGDKITVWQFSNHDSQGLDRQSYDIVERTELLPGFKEGTQTFQLDGSTDQIDLPEPLLAGERYAIFLNNVRIDDPNFGTGLPVSNTDAYVQTIVGTGQTSLGLDDLGIVTFPEDILRIEQLNAEIIPDASTPGWYELRQLRAGIVPLRYPAVDDQYVWVIVNGKILNPSVDYVVTSDKMNVKLLQGLNENDNVETIHYANNLLRNKFGWRQFKDILNRNHYKVLDGTKNIRLLQNLNWYDREIYVENGETLPAPLPDSKNPGVIFIEGERIEYLKKDGQYLKNLRRGTLGTGVKNVYSEGTEVYDQNAAKSLPYKDETLTTLFTADGTTKTYELDFTPTSVNEFEVFVAGRRLRKNTLQSYQLDTNLRTTYGTNTDLIAQDSPEGDITLPAEFSLQNGNELVLLDLPLENQKIIVIRRQGKIWNDTGKTLSNSDTDIARFLRSTKVDLPR
tara:strand:- start:11138 stop:26881 length:15744 start_codon:yes stop_codon:yes gene_type:complete